MEITFSFACGSAVPGEIGTVGKKWDKMNNLIKRKKYLIIWIILLKRFWLDI